MLAGPLLWLWLAERSFSRLLNRAYPDGFGFWKRTEQRRSLLERDQDLMAEMQEYEERKREGQREKLNQQKTPEEVYEELQRAREDLNALLIKHRGYTA